MAVPLLRRDRAFVAVTVMLDVAFHGGRTQTVSAAEIAERLGLARRGMEPLLQALSRDGLLESIRGPRGGYRLGRAARDIRLSDVAAAASRGDVASTEGPVGDLQEAAVAPLWRDLDETIWQQLSALTLNDLIRRAETKGMRRPATEPISFVI